MIKFSKEQIDWINTNRDQIKKLLEDKYNDIISELLIEKDAVRSEVLKLLVEIVTGKLYHNVVC